MFIKFADGVEVDEITTKIIDALNGLYTEDVWDDSDDLAATYVITDDELYEASTDDDAEDDEVGNLDDIDGVNLCTLLAEIPNADYSLVLTQDEDDETVWYVAKCNYDDDGLRVIDDKYQIDGSSEVI